VLRLSHPFPSALNGLATAGLALLAGGSWAIAMRLGLAMLALQASIGALNDLRDARADAIGKPSKPIPAGLVRPRTAQTLGVAALVLGLLLTWPSGPAAIAIAVLGVGCGYAYDLWLKPTPLSWLPLAVALPLLPAFAWVGAGAGLPPAYTLLVPLAIAAGAGLALANALADVERDRGAGLVNVVVRLGPSLAWRVHVGLHLVVITVAFALLGLVGGRGPGVMLALVGAGLLSGGALLSRGGGAPRRERAWELEAIGVAVLGVGWLAATAGLGA
jgi:4-hydroxybenzoate polyprenyltransferase